MYYANMDYILCMIPAFLITMLAQIWVSSTYRKWLNVRNSMNVSGGDAAQRLLAAANLQDVDIKLVRGQLTDHFDPRSNTLGLSQQVAQVPSVASLAIAAHEIGHAAQNREGYTPLKLRSALVPMVNIGSYLGWILLAIGIGLRSLELAGVGLIVFSAGAVFALATLPVELNASKRARQLLTDSGLVYSDEEKNGVSSVLNAAAFTYVAGLATAVMQLLYFGSMVAGLGRRR
jgi:hypothetical protein